MDDRSGAGSGAAATGEGGVSGEGNRTGLMIDALGNGDVQLSFCRKDTKAAYMTGIPKRQARAIAHRILHEIDFAEGRRSRRPSSPHIGYEDRVETQHCSQCGAFPVREVLDGDRLCQACCDKWVRAERPDAA